MTSRSFLLALCLIGCQTTPSPDPAAPDSSAVAGPSVSEAPSEGPALSLDAEGLRLIDPASGAARPLPFGTDWEQTRAAIARLRGEPAEEGTNTECGAGPLAYATWRDGLTLHGAEGRFAGWSVSGPASDASGAYTTMAGLGVGTTRAELDEAYDAEVREGTLGTEFDAGNLFGLLSGTTAQDRVIHLWAGTSCNFG